MHNVFFSKLTLCEETPAVVGRCVAKQAQGDRGVKRCQIYRENGHSKDKCPKFDPNLKKKSRKISAKKKNSGGSGGGAKGRKFRSLCKTINDSDSERNAQR